MQCAPRCAIPASSLDVQLNAPSGCRFGCECAIRARWRNEKCNLILVHALHLHRRVTERLSEEKRGSSMGHGAALLRAQWSHCGGLRDTGPTLFSSTILGGIVYRHVPYRPPPLRSAPLLSSSSSFLLSSTLYRAQSCLTASCANRNRAPVHRRIWCTYCQKRMFGSVPTPESQTLVLLASGTRLHTQREAGSWKLALLHRHLWLLAANKRMELGEKVRPQGR